jgi:hypothetical protein
MRNAANRWFVATFAFSLAISFFAASLPSRRMPTDFHSMFWFSFPLAGLWLITLAVASVHFGRKAFWLLIGAPLSLYWPLWLIFNGIPACYWHGNCV